MIDLLQVFTEAFLRLFRRGADGRVSPMIVIGAVVGVVFFALIIVLVALQYTSS